MANNVGFFELPICSRIKPAPVLRVSLFTNESEHSMTVYMMNTYMEGYFDGRPIETSSNKEEMNKVNNNQYYSIIEQHDSNHGMSTVPICYNWFAENFYK